MVFCTLIPRYKYFHTQALFLLVIAVFLSFSNTIMAGNSTKSNQDTLEAAIEDFNKNDLDKALADIKLELDSISKLSNPQKLAIVYAKYATAQQLNGNYNVAI